MIILKKGCNLLHEFKTRWSDLFLSVGKSLQHERLYTAFSPVRQATVSIYPQILYAQCPLISPPANYLSPNFQRKISHEITGEGSAAELGFMIPLAFSASIMLSCSHFIKFNRSFVDLAGCSVVVGIV